MNERLLCPFSVQNVERPGCCSPQCALYTVGAHGKEGCALAVIAEYGGLLEGIINALGGRKTVSRPRSR